MTEEARLRRELAQAKKEIAQLRSGVSFTASGSDAEITHIPTVFVEGMDDIKNGDVTPMFDDKGELATELTTLRAAADAVLKEWYIKDRVSAIELVVAMIPSMDQLRAARTISLPTPSSAPTEGTGT